MNSNSLVSTIQSEIQRVQEDLIGVEENLKRLTGRDFNEPIPRAERRVRQISLGGREDEPPSKRRPPGGVFARLGEPVADHRGRRVQEVLEEGEIPRQKPSIASSVARPINDGKSRTEAAAELTRDRASRDRNRRMFGALLGTLQRFRTEEAKQKGKDEQRAKIERKLEEKGRAEKEELRKERLDLLSQRKERQLRIKRLSFKIERVKEHEAWEANQRRLEKFIRTHSKPRIFWLPKIHVTRTSNLLAHSKDTIERELEDVRQRLKEELDEELGGRTAARLLKEEEEEDEEEEGEREVEQSVENLDYNNGSDLLDYDAEEGELVYEDDLLLSGKKQKGGGGERRVVVQVESSVNQAPQRRVELVTVVTERGKRVREVEENESEKENLVRKVTLESKKVIENGDKVKSRGSGREKEKKSKEREKSKGKEKKSDKRSPEKAQKHSEKVSSKNQSVEKKPENISKKSSVEKSSEKLPKVHSSKKESKSAKKEKFRGEEEPKEGNEEENADNDKEMESQNENEREEEEKEPEDNQDYSEVTTDATNEALDEDATNICSGDLSQINLPLDPEPDTVPILTEVVVQHVPMDADGNEDGNLNEGEMQVETVLIDTSKIKEEKTVWDNNFIHHLPMIIKKEKDATPEKEVAEKGKETLPKTKEETRRDESNKSSSDSSSESESSSSDEEGEEGEESSSEEESSSAASSSSSSENDDKKDKKKKIEKRKRENIRRKSGSSSSSSESEDSDSSSSEDEKDKKDVKRRRTDPQKSPSKHSRRNESERVNDRKKEDRKKDARKSRSTSKSRNKRSRSRDRRRVRSRSRDRKRERR